MTAAGAAISASVSSDSPEIGSKMRFTPLPPVMARIRSTRFSLETSITAWAPPSHRAATLDRLRVVAMTRAPWSRATWIAARPTPPVAAVSSTQSSGRTAWPSAMPP